MTIQKPIVKIFQEIVNGLNTDIMYPEGVSLLEYLQAVDTNIRTINYLCGPFVEILETLSQYDNDPEKMHEKYPLIMLIQDFPEENSEDFNSEVKLRIAIAHHTVNTYKTMERYDNVFIPVLYPIYTRLMQAIAESRYFMVESVGMLSHTKRDRVYWGREALGGGKRHELNDYVDAIEITNLKITVDLTQCSFPINS